MATRIEAAPLLTRKAARKSCVEESFRIHGGYGCSKDEIERLYRDQKSG